MSDIKFVTSAIVSSWIVGPWFGLNLSLYFICARLLLRRWSMHGCRVLFMAATVQIGLCTGHLVAMFAQLLQGLPVDEQGVGRLDNAYFINQATHAHIAQEVIYITNSLVGDAIMIWRVYVVWSGNRFIFWPLLLLLLGTGISGYTAMAHLAHLDPFNAVFDIQVAQWIEATWCLSIATQILTTLLIGFKLIVAVREQRNIGLMQTSVYLSAFWAIIESGALYSLTTVMLLAFYVRGWSAGAICAAILGQLSATAPYLIVVRAEMNRQRHKRHQSTPLPNFNALTHGHRSPGTSPQASQATDYELDRIISPEMRSMGVSQKDLEIIIETDAR
ncbi:unnamed protein product [Peniophora sp. CBMAI 1063]|nr:unnamed protein product [Peniophora sp. CBMAI 1063]